jgi:hypothetical protein
MKEAGSVDPVKLTLSPCGSINPGRVYVIGFYTDDILLLRAGEKYGNGSSTNIENVYSVVSGGSQTVTDIVQLPT